MKLTLELEVNRTDGDDLSDDLVASEVINDITLHMFEVFPDPLGSGDPSVYSVDEVKRVA